MFISEKCPEPGEETKLSMSFSVFLYSSDILSIIQKYVGSNPSEVESYIRTFFCAGLFKPSVFFCSPFFFMFFLVFVYFLSSLFFSLFVFFVPCFFLFSLLCILFSFSLVFPGFLQKDEKQFFNPGQKKSTV